LLGAAAPAQRLVRERDRLWVLAALEVDPRELERRVGLGVVRAHGLAQLRDRAIPVAEIARRESGEEAREALFATSGCPGRTRRARRPVALRQQDPAAQELRVIGARETIRHGARAVEIAHVDQRVGEHETHALVIAAGELGDLLDRRQRAMRFAARSVERREQIPHAHRFEVVGGVEQHLLGLAGPIDRLQPRGEPLAQLELIGRRRHRVAPEGRAARGIADAVVVTDEVADHDGVGRLAIRAIVRRGASPSRRS